MPPDRAVRGVLVGPDDHHGRQLLGRARPASPARRGARFACSAHQASAAGPSSASPSTSSRPRASTATTSRSSARSPPGRAAGADRQPDRLRSPPRACVPKWISIMKNVMSWRTTSSSGVRFEVERSPRPRSRSSQRHRSLSLRRADQVRSSEPAGSGADREGGTADGGQRVRASGRPGANCSRSDSAAIATSSESRAIRLRKSA